MDDDTDIFDIDPKEAWLEKITIGGFRRWHIIAAVLGILMSISECYSLRCSINTSLCYSTGYLCSDHGLLLHSISHTTHQTGNRSRLSTQTNNQKVSREIATD